MITRCVAQTSLAGLLLLVACRGGDGRSSNAEANAEYAKAAGLEKNWISAEEWRGAEVSYRRATELDSNFALAYAGLGRIHAGMVHWKFDPTAERRALSKQAASTALRLQPDLGEAHHAMGMYWYWAERDYQQAAVELEAASKRLPKSAEVLAATAYVVRRQGKAEQALDYLQRAAALDSTNALILTNLGDTHEALGQYDEAVAAYQRAMAAQPTGHHEMGLVAIWFRRTGTLDSSKRALQNLPADFDPDGRITQARFDLAFRQHLGPEAVRIIGSSPHAVIVTQGSYLPRQLLSARAYRLSGDARRARLAFDSARSILAAAVKKNPDDARMRVSLASALAGLGLARDAAREAKQAAELMPLERDALLGPEIALQVAAVYADIGESGTAVGILERAFAVPLYGFSRSNLRQEPTWDRLRGNPRFKEIVTGQ